MKKPFFFAAVDRVEKSIAVLEADDGRRFEVPVKSFKHRPKEGVVYRVALDAAGDPDWPHAMVDPAEEARRRDKLQVKMNAMRSQDDGGDIKL